MSQKKKSSLEEDLFDSLMEDDEQSNSAIDVPSNVNEESRSEIEAEGAAPLADDSSQSGEFLLQMPDDEDEPEFDEDNTVQVSDPPDIQDLDKTNVVGQEQTQKLDVSLSAKTYPSEKISFGRVAPEKVVQTSGPASALEASLTQSENLRMAQNRILELEDELEKVRQENEQLAAAGETLRRKSDDLMARAEKAELNLNEEKYTFSEEKKIYKNSLEDKDRESARLREKIEELELRLDSDLKKIRVRERELENRLELVKMEEAALLRNKDEIILDLKRRIDQLTSEVENYRGRSLELHKKMEGDQDKLRRTVRALRLALSMLEDGDASVVPLKKAE